MNTPKNWVVDCSRDNVCLSPSDLTFSSMVRLQGWPIPNYQAPKILGCSPILSSSYPRNLSVYRGSHGRLWQTAVLISGYCVMLLLDPNYDLKGSAVKSGKGEGGWWVTGFRIRVAKLTLFNISIF